MNSFIEIYVAICLAVIAYSCCIFFAVEGPGNWAKWQWTRLTWAYWRAVDGFQWWAAMHMPRWMVYLGAIRLMSAATTGKYSNTEVGEVRAVTCLKRWEKSE